MTGAPPPTTSPPSTALSDVAGRMVAGILRHLHEILAILAPSVISGARLQPHRWSAAFNNLGFRDREAAVRICPVGPTDPAAAAKFNFEIRASDAAAGPHLVLAALAHAMAEGVERQMAAPDIASGDSVRLGHRRARAKKGLQRLPTTLDEALRLFTQSDAVRRWFGAKFVGVYTAHKLAEIAYLADKAEAEHFRLYREVY